MIIDGVEYVRADEVQSLPPSEENGPWEVGKIYHVRTLTYAIAGKLAWVGDKELKFSEGSWIADSGRFSEYLKGNYDDNFECEPFSSSIIVCRNNIVDAALIDSFCKEVK